MAALMEEYERLDAEDHVAGVACRFRYREVPAEDYGLRTEDLLLLPDKELNQARLPSRQPPGRVTPSGCQQHCAACPPRSDQAICRLLVKAAHALPALPFVYSGPQLCACAYFGRGTCIIADCTPAK